MLPTITNRRPASSLRHVRSPFGMDLEDWLGDVFTRPASGWQSWTPTADLFETDEEFVLEMELAGFDRDELEITVDNGVLTVSGERTTPESEDANYYVRERTSARFSRSFDLPRSVDAEKVDARLENGLLHVALPKVAEARPRRIEVQAG